MGPQRDTYGAFVGDLLSRWTPNATGVSFWGAAAVFGGTVIFVRNSVATGTRIQATAPSAHYRHAFGLDVDVYVEGAAELLGPSLRISPMWVTRVPQPGGTTWFVRAGYAARVTLQWSVLDPGGSRPAIRGAGDPCIRPGVLLPPPRRGPRVTISTGACVEIAKWVDGWLAFAVEPALAVGFVF